MLDPIRLATPEEVKAIAENSDITPRTNVFAFDNAQTGHPDLAVVRQATEVDPWHIQPASDIRRKVAFIWGLENILRSNGLTEYYFNVHPSDEEWIRNCEKFGAVKVSTEPEWRFKKLL